MRKKFKWGFEVGLGILIFGFCFSALAIPEDYKKPKAEFNLGTKINQLAVSKNRFIAIASQSNQRLYFIDSWNWRVLNPVGSDTVNLAGIISSMDITPSGNRLYFAYGNRKIRWMDLTNLHNLGFDQSLTPSNLPLMPGVQVNVPDVLNSESVELGKIVALQDSDSVSVDCIFVELKGKNSTLSMLGWLLVKGNSSLGGGYLENTLGKNFELAKSDKRLLLKLEDISGNNWIDVYQCFSESLGNKIAITYLNGEPPYAIDPSQKYQGISVNKTGNIFILGNQTKAQLLPIEIAEGPGGTLTALLGPPYDRLSAIPAGQIFLSKFSPEPDSLVFFTQANSLMLSSLNKDSAEFKPQDPYLIENFSSSPLLFASSSSKDGYLYIAPENTEKLFVITANPWINNLHLSESETVSKESFKVKFNTDLKHSYYTIRECSSFAINPSECGKMITSGELKGSTADIPIKSKDLGDGSHILGVFVRDNYSAPYHQGRNAIQVAIDLPPPAQDFEMGFGDEKIFIKFHSSEAKDLKKYTIYYGTYCNVGFYQADKIDQKGGNGDPPSPIVIDDPEPDKDYEKIIEGLINGTTYCAQIVMLDKSGQKSYSERKYATPEETKDPSEEIGEEGGLDCLSVISGREIEPTSSELILLLLPLIIMLIKIKLRSKE